MIQQLSAIDLTLQVDSLALLNYRQVFVSLTLNLGEIFVQNSHNLGIYEVIQGHDS